MTDKNIVQAILEDIVALVWQIEEELAELKSALRGEIKRTVINDERK